MIQADQFPQTLDPSLLLVDPVLLIADLPLLRFEGVDEYCRELIVPDPFDVSFVISKGEQRLNLLNAFKAQQRQISDQQHRINKQQARIKSLRKLVCLDHPNA